MRVGLVQLNASDMPLDNLAITEGMIREAVAGGAEFVATPEVTNIISTSRSHQKQVLNAEADDPTLARLRAVAADLKTTLLIGSLAVLSGDADGRFANRSFLIGPDGEILGRYDKIHMFDVDIDKVETWRESDGYRPGGQAVVADSPVGRIGMTICYDMRFPALYRHLAQSGAEILTIPAAFSPVTGKAHWEILLRARAIETGCFVIAPAQCGDHSVSRGRPRQTHGHSLIVAPWGEVLADGGSKPGVTLTDIDLDEVAKARARVPSLSHDRPFEVWG